jgi:hypothetical protein
MCNIYRRLSYIHCIRSPSSRLGRLSEKKRKWKEKEKGERKKENEKKKKMK